MATRKKKVAAPASAAELAAAMSALRDDMASMKATYDAYAQALLETLKAEGRKREGIFTRAVRQTLVITNAKDALAWAEDKNVMKSGLDTAKAMQVIRRELQVPAGFEVRESEYITASASKEDSESNEE